MNWETTKTWLIAIFLVLDVVLGWQLMQSRNELRGYVESSSDVLANTKTLLADHGFTLATTVPQEHPNLPSFSGNYAAPPLTVLAATAFPNAKSKVDDTNNDSLSLLSVPEGHIRSLTNGWQVAYTQPVAVNSANHLLSYVWHGSDYAADAVASAGPSQVYVEQYDGYPIYDVNLIFATSNSSLVGYTQMYLTQINPTSEAKPIISALDALVSLANSVDKSGSQADNRILKIDLGFAQKVVVTPSITTPSNDYWFPVWRVFTDSQIYYINALTGEVDTAP